MDEENISCRLAAHEVMRVNVNMCQQRERGASL
jgi:hypothetical protein